MPDKEYRIRVVTVADNAGIRQTQQGFEDFGKAGAKAHQDVAQAAEHAELKHRDLHAAVRSLGLQFPILAEIAHFALNPIGLLVAAIVSAFGLFQQRLQALQQLLGGFELPEATPDKTAQISAAANAWQQYGDAIRKAGEAYHSVDAASDRVTGKIKQQLEEQKKLLAATKGLELADLESKKGSMSPEQYEGAKNQIEQRYANAGLAAEQRAESATFFQRARRATDLRTDADFKMRTAAGIHVAGSEADTKTEAALAAQAEVAEKEIKERRERLNNLLEFKSGEAGWLTSIKVKTQQLLTALSPDELIAMEREGIDRAEIPIQRFREFSRRRAGRERLRKNRDELISSASAEAGEATSLDEAFPDDLSAFRGKRANENRIRTLENSPFGAAATGDVQAALTTAQELERGRQVSEESKEQLTQVASAIAGHSVSLAAAVKMMDYAAKGTGEFVTSAQRLANAMVVMASSHAALQSQTNMIEAQVREILSRPSAIRLSPGSG